MSHLECAPDPGSGDAVLEFLKSLILPSGFIALLFVCGLIARFARPLQRFSGPLLATGAVLTLVFSSPKTATALLSPLEYEYPAIVDARAHPHAKHIVVLTGWAADEPALALSDRMNSSSAYRVLLALEYWHQRPELDVIVSGSRTTAHVMAATLEAGGVPRERLRLEDASRSTADSAAFLKTMVGTDPFLLVTSGGHLRRSMGAMRGQGLAPIAAPTDHKLPRDISQADWAPNPDGLAASDLAVHEYFGTLWYRLRGKT
jgi:uncharacterized SAM-binding protein YcdF (DUF218 family)